MTGVLDECLRQKQQRRPEAGEDQDSPVTGAVHQPAVGQRSQRAEHGGSPERQPGVELDGIAGLGDALDEEWKNREDDRGAQLDQQQRHHQRHQGSRT